ncbi:UvrD-helicase domain-containing protein [Bifidobacterium parmae]|uniref:DNA 3'-5' helicase n=1 Tax=Bifidobacterium parmae TaxID=361854 RepID=A0A2N5J4N1_9BIFI|nr:UvrD-helicase domain-containing protein [Bifidobacterium parmae]PLS29170.1 UvrD-like helicase C-terminal domain-containing protein [Bifidobacterium parmae]
MKELNDMSPNTYVINASAGTGKTTRLLQDVLADLLERNMDSGRSAFERSIRSSLVITFTEAAAAEMRRRLETNLRFTIDYARENAHRVGGSLAKTDDGYVIGGDDGRLAKLILADCDKAQNVFTQALDDLPAAQISTIDALSKRIVDRNAELLPDVEPGQQILSDEAMRHDLQRQVMDTLFERWYGEKSEGNPYHDDFLALLEQFGGPYGDAGLRDMMFRLYDTALTKPNRLDWLKGLSNRFDIEIRSDEPVYGSDIVPKRYIDEAIEEFTTAYDELHEAVAAVIADCEAQYPDADPWRDSEQLRLFAHLEGLPERMRSETWNFLFDLFRDEEGDLYRACVSDVNWNRNVFEASYGKNLIKGNDDRNTRVTSAISAIRKPLQRLLSIFALDADDTNKLNAMLKHRIDTLVALIGELDTAYKDEKKLLHLADFSDIAEWAVQVLEDEDGKHPEAVERIRSQWRYIYVDESQDDNALQNAFIRLISAKADKLTMVGDIKQSIYGFRDASPEAFLEICRNVSETHVSQLWTNYRSTPEIITFVNAVFDGLMTNAMGKADYRAERLCMREDARPGTGVETPTFDPCAVELLLRDSTLPEEDESDDGSEKKRDTAIELQVDMIVRRIRQLHDDEGYAYGDIAVLARGATYFGDLAERLLASGIPVEVKGVGDFYKKPEIVVALNWLRVIDNAHRGVPMVAVLRTLGFTDDDLARLRQQNRGGLYGQIYVTAKDTDDTAGASDGDGLRASAPEWLTDELRCKCRAFLNLLDDLRAFAKAHPVDELLWHLYTAVGLFDYAGRLPDGKQRKANLESLAAKARTYESTQAQGLRPFLDAVEAWSQDKKAGEEASTVPTKDAVHIMTIHKAKGLQWRAVILMNAAADLLSNVTKESIPVVPEVGADHGIAGMDFRSTKRELRLKTPQREDALDRLKIRSVEDELRLLYVALTRPKEKLIIAATVDPVKKKEGDDSPDTLSLAELVSGMLVVGDGDPDGERMVLAPKSMVATPEYLSWIMRGLIAWNQNIGAGGLVALNVPDEWKSIPVNGSRTIPIPQNPADADPRTSRSGLCVTVSFHGEAAEPPTVMTADTPGYATTLKRMNVLAAPPMLDGDDLPRVPAAVNASGARYWLADVTQAAGDGDAETDDAADAAADGVIVDDKDAHEWRRNDFALPSFMAEGSAAYAPSPAEVGTGAHNVLELFDWTGPATAAACRKRLGEAIDRLESRGLVSAAVADVLRGDEMMRSLLWFVSGGKAGVKEPCELAATIRRHADRLYREEPFTMLIGANELKRPQGGKGAGAETDTADSPSTWAGGEEVVVRGIIDGYVVDDATKSIILFDYKTDRLQGDEAHRESVGVWKNRLADEYRQQQDLYARALEQRYPGYRVTERWLVGLAGHRLIDVR